MLPQTIVCQTSQSFSQFPAVTFMFLVNFKAQSVVWCFSINFAPKYNKDNCFRFLPKFLKFKDLLYHQYPSTSDFQKLLIQFNLKDFKIIWFSHFISSILILTLNPKAIICFYWVTELFKHLINWFHVHQLKKQKYQSPKAISKCSEGHLNVLFITRLLRKELLIHEFN